MVEPSQSGQRVWEDFVLQNESFFSLTPALSRGGVALLGIAQRQIRVSRAHIPATRHLRKLLPTSIQTIGGLIQIKRYET